MVTPKAFSIRLLFAAAAIAIFLIPDTWAQMPSNTLTTSTPIPGVGHDYLGELAETVDPATGSVSFRISTTMPAGRGLTLPFSFAYDSKGWYVNTIVSTGGWTESAPVVSAAQLKWTAIGDGGGQYYCWAYLNYMFQDPSGNRHNLNLTNYEGNTQNDACTYDTTHWPRGFDGTVITQAGEDDVNMGDPPEGSVIGSIPAKQGTGVSVGPVSVTQPDGTTFYFPDNATMFNQGQMATSVEDRNGNVIQITSSSPGGSYSYTDTLGRTVLQSSGFATNPETVTISGFNASYTLQRSPFSGSYVQPVTIISGNCGGPCNGTVNPSGSGVTSLKLPNGKSFSFTYDPTYGAVNKMTYPTGAYVRYVWGMNPQAEFNIKLNGSNQQFSYLYGVPVITDRYVSFDGNPNHEVLHQQFSYSTNWNINYTTGVATCTSKTTQVTTYDLVRNTHYQTVYTYWGTVATSQPNTPWNGDSGVPFEKSIAYYDVNGALLKTVYKTWANPRLLTSLETQYPVGQNPNGPANETTWKYNGREQEIETDDYDFGTGGVGSLLRKTVTNYQAFNSTPIYPNGPSIVDRPCQVITNDSTGTNRVAATDYFYDNGSTTTPCATAGRPSLAGAGGSSLTGHDETNYSVSSTSPRGNLTQKTQWLNTGSSPVTTYAYDETGQVLSMTDPCGNPNGMCSDMSGTSHTTTYSYSDSFLNTNSSGFTTTAGSPPSGMVTNAYLTKLPIHPQTASRTL